jgi:hypothetical protein
MRRWLWRMLKLLKSFHHRARGGHGERPPKGKFAVWAAGCCGCLRAFTTEDAESTEETSKKERLDLF